MNIRTLIVTALCTVVFYSTCFADDWGKTGHRATAQIAEKYLTKKAKKRINELLSGQSLALVSTYADEIKSERSYKNYSPWHYVNFDFDKEYGAEAPSERGDLVIGIQKCIDILKNKSSSQEDKEFHLKLLVHFIGDLHQPLHVGRGEDKGGNDIQVRWFNEGTNLHRLWDTNMIEHYKMSYSELAANAAVLSAQQIEDIEKGSVLDWVYESQDLAEKVYESATVGEKLGYRYVYDYFPLLRAQLQKGGIRLAKVLNDIFG
ncbi:S1/P1 nuclease [Aquimarina brevivitae]|uniref:S1/P1 nuclease n=1 Tax=Aquimarina brevivitae TaxID=323412 RepID=A0A4Q7P020_9FLAO|nr:S1/P1 nuclease [Aquimarina brevivitae]RZS93113.1 S1/P1 nuclease [Aquimarina brevivitae]